MPKCAPAIVALIALALTSLPVSAALDPAQQTCQKQVARQGKGFFGATSGALRRCHNRIASGQLPPATDCTLEAQTAARISAAAGRLTARITASCPDAVVQSLVFGGDCLGMPTGAELAQCELDTHQDQVLALIETMYDGSGAVTDMQTRACQRTAAGASSSFALRRLGLIQTCKNKLSKGTLPAGTNCETELATPLGNALTGATNRIQMKCPDAVVASLGFGTPCASVATGAGLASCALSTHRDRSGKLIVAEYGSGSTGGTATAKQIANTADCVGGPLSRCRVNDYLLANDKIRVVIQDVQRNLFGIGQFGGSIIDVDSVAAPDRDNFEEWTTAINLENAAHYTSVTIINDGSDGQPAIIRAAGVDDLLDFVNPSSVVADFGFTFPVSADDKDLPVEVATDYVLEPGRNYLRVETTVTNTSASAFNIFFGEYLNGSGQVELFQPGYGFGEPLVAATCPSSATNPCNVAAYAGYGDAVGVSYGYVHDVPGSSTFSTAGVTVPLLGREVALALIGAAGPNFPLAATGSPGDSQTFTRHFVVGDGTVSSILDARNEIQCLPSGRLEGTVTQAGSPVARAEVVVLGNPAEGPGQPLSALLTRNLVSHTLTDALGRYSLTVLPGSYNVVANLDGSPFEGAGSSPVQHPVTITSYDSVTQDIDLPATGAIQVTVTDDANPTPNSLSAKASVVGFDPSPDPRNTQSVLGLINNTTGVFGDLSKDGLPFGVAQALFIGPSGDSGVVSLEPGSYQVVVSHGTEYSIAKSNITVVAGATSNVNAQLASVLDTSGFISSDYHVHSIDSPDSSIAKVDRVVSMLAEGVDFFTPSDHDIRVDFAPIVTALGATSLISVATNGEITTFDYGHFNAWPMTIDPAQVNGGSVDHSGAAPDGFDFPIYGNYSLTPAQIIAAAAADPGTNTVQINHIHSHFGLTGGSGLAIDTGLTPPQSAVPAAARRLDPAVTNYFSSSFNALEVWIGDDRGQIYTNFLGQNAGDWFNMINQGIVRSGVADSDTHKRIITQAGIPRTFVASPTDAPGAIGAIAETISANVNAGRAIGSNGPMVRVTTSASSTGEMGGLELGLPTLITTTDGAVDVTVDIQSPVWAEFDTVEYYVNTTTTKSTFNKQSGAGVVNVKRYSITPDFVQTTTNNDFTVSTVNVNPSVPGAERLEASTTLSLTGLTEDIWVVVMVKGTDGVSRPLFPVVPNSLKTSTNTTLANLTDGNLNEDGITALAFTNPLFVDVDGGGWTPPGVQVSNP